MAEVAPHHVNWKTVGVVLGFAAAIFGAGAAYQKLEKLEDDMSYLRARVDEIYRSMPAHFTASCDSCAMVRR